MFNRSRALLAGLLAALGGAMPRYRTPAYASTKKVGAARGFIAVRHSRYKPRQGFRECMRRRGGEEWAQYKAFDRAHRGLPTGLMESGRG